MKKVISFLLILFASVLLCHLQAKSDCPDGYSEYDFQIWINNCQYNVQVCYKCPSPEADGDIKVFGFGKVDPGCPQTWNTNQVYDVICSQVYTESFILGLCPPPVPPCDQGGIYYEYVYYRCWYKLKDMSGKVWYAPCYTGECFCFDVWKYCWDPGPPPLISLVHVLSPEMNCNYECNDDEPFPDPTPGNQSTCFHLQTPCQ